MTTLHSKIFLKNIGFDEDFFNKFDKTEQTYVIKKKRLEKSFQRMQSLE